MTRFCGAVCVFVALLTAVPANAQSTGGAAGPVVNSWYVGINTGAAVVDKFSGVVGFDGGVRVWRTVDVVGDLTWAGNVVSRRQLDRIGLLATHLGQTQGRDASGSATASLLYGGLGARWVFEQEGRLRPYALVTIGGAKRKIEPTLRLDGSDVTGSAKSYGITLGQDLSGTVNDFASEVGLGVVMGYGTWYVDGGARLISINGGDGRVNVARLVVGGGYRF